MTCTAGARRVDGTVPQRPRCSGGECEGHKGTVILGLDPRIHVNKLALLLIWIAGSHPQGDAKWIPGSSPGMTKKIKCPGMTKKIKCPGMTCTAGARRVDGTVPQRPRCSGGVCEGYCALKLFLLQFRNIIRKSHVQQFLRVFDFYVFAVVRHIHKNGSDIRIFRGNICFVIQFFAPQHRVFLYAF